MHSKFYHPIIPYILHVQEVFQLIVSSFENLSDKSSRSFAKRTSILETVAKVRSCVVMLDLECDALLVEMFQHFLKAIRYELTPVKSSLVILSLDVYNLPCLCASVCAVLNRFSQWYLGLVENGRTSSITSVYSHIFSFSEVVVFHPLCLLICQCCFWFGFKYWLKW